MWRRRMRRRRRLTEVVRPSRHCLPPTECADVLRTGQVDAVATGNSILSGIVADGSRMLLRQEHPYLPGRYGHEPDDPAMLLSQVSMRSSNHDRQSTFSPAPASAAVYEAVSVSRCTMNVDRDCRAMSSFRASLSAIWAIASAIDGAASRASADIDAPSFVNLACCSSAMLRCSASAAREASNQTVQCCPPARGMSRFPCGSRHLVDRGHDGQADGTYKRPYLNGLVPVLDELEGYGAALSCRFPGSFQAGDFSQPAVEFGFFDAFGEVGDDLDNASTLPGSTRSMGHLTHASLR